MTPEQYLRVHNWQSRRGKMYWTHPRFGTFTLVQAVALQLAERRAVLAFELGFKDEREMVEVLGLRRAELVLGLALKLGEEKPANAPPVKAPAAPAKPSPAPPAPPAASLVLGVAGEGDSDEPPPPLPSARVAPPTPVPAATPKKRIPKAGGPVVVNRPPSRPVAPPVPAEPEPEPPAPVEEPLVIEDEPHDDLPSGHRCRPAPPTPELLAARAGITHKHIRGDREADLIRRYQAGDRHAGEILLRAHAPLIAFFAKKYNKGRHDIPWEDILAEAQIGFLKGVERFDPTRGFKLGTYAPAWIRHKVQRVIADAGNTIRVPVHMRGPQVEGEKRYEREARHALSMAHLDAPLGDTDDSLSLGDILAAPEDVEGGVAEDEERRVLKAVMARALAALPPRLADILRRRTDGQTLEEVGDLYGVSRERIRQLEVEGKRALRRTIGRLRGNEARTIADVVERAGGVLDTGGGPVGVSGQKRCGNCGELGHNRAGCKARRAAKRAA